MQDVEVWELLRQFFTGGSLVAAYIVFYIVKLVLKPLYKNGEVIRSLALATTKALNEGVFSHREIVVELRALNAILSKQEERRTTAC